MNNKTWDFILLVLSVIAAGVAIYYGFKGDMTKVILATGSLNTSLLLRLLFRRGNRGFSLCFSGRAIEAPSVRFKTFLF